MQDPLGIVELPPAQPMDAPGTRPDFNLWSMAVQVMKIQSYLRKMRERKPE